MMVFVKINIGKFPAKLNTIPSKCKNGLLKVYLHHPHPQRGVKK